MVSQGSNQFNILSRDLIKAISKHLLYGQLLTYQAPSADTNAGTRQVLTSHGHTTSEEEVDVQRGKLDHVSVCKS